MMRTLAALLALIAFSLPGSALAATLNVLPSAPSVTAGNIVTVRLVTNTSGVAINQGGAVLDFPTDMLDVVSVSKSGSIFSLWVEEPSYSNASGVVRFDGGVPNPGFTGSSGTVLSITFLAKKAGVATLSLRDAAIRANDGMGTDVLTSSGGATVTIAAAAPAPAPVTPAPETPAPAAPAAPAPSGGAAIADLSSPTHGDQGAWYRNTSPLMTWVLPDGATAIETIADADADAAPSVLYRPAIVERRIAELSDGVWYFNIRARVGNAWGPVASYRLQIDSTNPELGAASFTYDAGKRALRIAGAAVADAASGIDRIEIAIDGETEALATESEFAGGAYELAYGSSGTHTVALRAYDKAGNYAEATGTFEVPTSLAEETLWNVGGLNITFGSFVILILLISLLSLAAAATAWYKLYTLRAGAKTRIEKRDKLLHRSLRIYKEDLERHLRTLERAGSKRELTDEEAELNEDLKRNVDDLERYLKKEFRKYD